MGRAVAHGQVLCWAQVTGALGEGKHGTTARTLSSLIRKRYLGYSDSIAELQKPSLTDRVSSNFPICQLFS